MRRYRFAVTFEIEPDHSAYDDPEWVADAAWGALVHEYGVTAVYSDIEAVNPDEHPG